MATLLILVTPCIALMSPFLSTAISVWVVLALAVTLIFLMSILFLQTCNMEDHDENEAIAEDATNIVRAAFAALARDPGATLASFRVVNGVVVHRDTAAAVPNVRDRSANWTEPEGMGEEREDWGADGGELEPRQLLHARGKGFGSSSSRKRPAAVNRLGRFWAQARSLEGSERISQMV